MKQLGIKIAVGIGDAIFIAAALNKVKDNYDIIYINPKWELAQEYKNNGKEYCEFYLQILKLLFNDPKFVIDDKSKNFEYITTYTLFNGMLSPVLPRFYDVLKPEKINTIEDDYICVTTKVRQLDVALYNKIKNDFISVLSKISKKYKLVLIGERIVEMNNEYNIFGNKYIYSIYNDVVKIDNVIDLTIPKLGITVPNLEHLKQDCSIMNDAKCVITLGCGGNFVLASSVANKLIAYKKDQYNFVELAFENNENFIIVNDGNLFLEKLKTLTEVL